jgi:fibronectin type 3 domain-containing protein
VIGLKVHGPEGRDDGWSTVSLDMQPALAAPRNLKPVDGPNAVHLEWAGDAPGYRIFRRLRGENVAEPEWAQIGESTQNSFDDKAFDYGKTWQYYVQAVRKVGDSWLESDASETVTFVPVDRFPPAVPAGLIAIAGTRTVELFWDAVTDSDLAGYRVYRNGVKIADAVMTAAYSDKDVVAGMKYSYQVSAVDAAGNESMRCGAQDVVME